VSQITHSSKWHAVRSTFYFSDFIKFHVFIVIHTFSVFPLLNTLTVILRDFLEVFATFSSL
jgi:hypothetical protein